MKRIPLTKGKVALVDDEDYDKLMKFKWFTKVLKTNFYAIRNANRRLREKPTTIRMHRVILGVQEPSVLVDHKDHNGLNNCRSNLRLVNPAQNNWNRRSKPGSSSRFVGVSFHKRDKKWQAQIYLNGKIVHLGQHGTEREAVTARDAAAKAHWGEYAHINLK